MVMWKKNLMAHAHQHQTFTQMLEQTCGQLTLLPRSTVHLPPPGCELRLAPGVCVALGSNGERRHLQREHDRQFRGDECASGKPLCHLIKLLDRTDAPQRELTVLYDWLLLAVPAIYLNLPAALKRRTRTDHLCVHETSAAAGPHLQQLAAVRLVCAEASELVANDVGVVRGGGPVVCKRLLQFTAFAGWSTGSHHIILGAKKQESKL
eukprot:6709695-Prymnesium_polylepis.1